MSDFIVDGGGITTSGSIDPIRSRMGVESESPGTITPAAIASSRRSSRRSAFRDALSAPWHEKQFSTKIGRMSRLYERGSASPCALVPAANHANTAKAICLAIWRNVNKHEPCIASRGAPAPPNPNRYSADSMSLALEKFRCLSQHSREKMSFLRCHIARVSKVN